MRVRFQMRPGAAVQFSFKVKNQPWEKLPPSWGDAKPNYGIGWADFAE
jgi:hypothetical protein